MGKRRLDKLTQRYSRPMPQPNQKLDKLSRLPQRNQRLDKLTPGNSLGELTLANMQKAGLPDRTTRAIMAIQMMLVSLWERRKTLKGMHFVDTTLNHLIIYDGTTWQMAHVSTRLAGQCTGLINQIRVLPHRARHRRPSRPRAPAQGATRDPDSELRNALIKDGSSHCRPRGGLAPARRAHRNRFSRDRGTGRAGSQLPAPDDRAGPARVKFPGPTRPKRRYRWTCTHWKAPPCHGAHPKRSFRGEDTIDQASLRLLR